jgi:PEP-CTERM/exosortase A-associated glycosyltransferase
LKREIVGRGIPAARVSVIPNAVDPEAFQFCTASDESLRRQLGLQDKRIVGFVGSFYAYEGLDLLLCAFLRLRASMPDVRVLLVGGGPEEEGLRKLAERLGLANEVIFAGRVRQSEVSRYYSLIDVLAYPRRSMRLTELVTPLKPLEAMAQGKLVAASDVGGHRELIRNHETGVLFRPGSAEALAEALVQLLSNSPEWGRLRRQARRFVEDERTWRKSVEGYGAIYASLQAART